MTPLLILDDDGFETYAEDIVLTPTPRPVVDWSKLPNDIVNIILKLAEYNEVEWRVNLFRPTFSVGRGLSSPSNSRPIRSVFDKRKHWKATAHGIAPEMMNTMVKICSKKDDGQLVPSVLKSHYRKKATLGNWARASKADFFKIKAFRIKNLATFL